MTTSTEASSTNDLNQYLDKQRAELWTYYNKLHDARDSGIARYVQLVPLPASLLTAAALLGREELQPVHWAILGATLILFSLVGLSTLVFVAQESANGQIYWSSIKWNYACRERHLTAEQRQWLPMLQWKSVTDRRPRLLRISQWRIVPVALLNAVLGIAGLACGAATLDIRPSDWNPLGLGMALLLSGFVAVVFQVLFSQWCFNAYLPHNHAAVMRELHSMIELSPKSNRSESVISGIDVKDPAQ
ncbi:MAG: hypothetical protein IT431_12425 [Phycisphaerales bacterium]|nr:hypothetical protein [Phycisphaerales bacterium]